MTPPIDGTLLAGITRDSIITIARDIGIPVSEQPIPRETLYTCDEAFFTGTAAEVTPIRSVDRIEVGNGAVGPITRTLQARLLGIARGQLPDPYGWLTVVSPVTADVGSLACAGARSAGRRSSPAAAASASAAPVANAAVKLTCCQSTPNSRLAGSAANPTLKWYAPNAAPRRSGGAAAATSAFSGASVNP